MDNQRWFLFLVAVVATGFVYLLAPILTPFLAGALLAYLCDPLADRLEDAGVSRNLAVVAVFVGLSLFVLIAVLVVLPNIGHQIGVLISQVPTVIGLVE
ncbi:MAG: AI-2E family transporter, partial [Pontibacterium sp.]